MTKPIRYYIAQQTKGQGARSFPQLFLVCYNGKRVDAFIHRENARMCVKRLNGELERTKHHACVN